MSMIAWFLGGSLFLNLVLWVGLVQWRGKYDRLWKTHDRTNAALDEYHAKYLQARSDLNDAIKAVSRGNQ